jgi:hypothetical protein
MNRVTDFTERFNQFLYRQNIRRLEPADVETAREWCFDLIRREYPHLNEEQREHFYQNLINVQITAVDEWTRRMS